jgi:uncharacterized SAM-binding protein YcdF (DUF218 family)
MMQFRYLIHSPLTWLLLLTLGLWIWLFFSRDPSTATRFGNFMLYGSLAAWCFLYAIATPLGSDFIRRCLTIEVDASDGFVPEYILVASCGYTRTAFPETDVLNSGGALRTAAAAHWHAAVPSASIVFAGSSRPNSARSDQAVYLMKQMAINLGVAEDKIVLEPLSPNSWAHLEEFLKFPGVDRSTKVGIVSSDYHLRRLRMIFSRAFDQLALRSPMPSEDTGFSLRGLLPYECTIGASAIYIRELLALCHYRVRL